MSREVLLTRDAARDLEDLYDFVAHHDAPAKTERVLKRIEKVYNSPSESLERCSSPKDLLSLGIRSCREVFVKPYRIICQVSGKSVYVVLAVDGCRDMQSLLQRRLLEA